MNKERTEKVVEEITSFVNTMSLDSEGFIEAMSREHRTLQQSFTKLCLKWIENCASDNYRYDPRNEASHEVCKKIVESFIDNNDIANVEPSNFLPMI